MYEYKKIIFLAALFSTVSPWVLKSTHINVVPNLTDDVTLRCHCENEETSKHKMDQLMRIRLLKRNDASNWMTLAEISVPNNSSVSLPDSKISSNILTSGHLGKSDESFLSVTWPTANDDIVGSYQCEVDGFGEDFRSDVHLSTQTVNITRFLPTSSDLVDIMIKMKHEIQSTVEDNFLEVRYWPTGNYSLLSPASGCPDTPFTTMVRGVIKLTTETKHEPNNAQSSPSHLHSDVFERCDSRNILHFRFCRNPIPDDQVVLWPKGSYCIYNYDWPNCPLGFNRGYIQTFLESSTSLTWEDTITLTGGHYASSYANFPFCCRNDEDPNVPVLLPNNKPFYLYRYKGRCQQVRNMDVSDEWIQLDTTSNDKYHYLKPDGDLNDLTIMLCYYTKRK